MRRLSISFTDDEIATLFDAVPRNVAIAVAVSGGGDSMALLSLAGRWNAKLTALTVDHGLRTDSQDEAALVARYCIDRNIEHEILRWEPDTHGNLPNQARIGRYTLMANACAARGIDVLLTGHTLDDQAETFLIRLGRGSGVDGLSGIRRRTMQWGLQIVRPLLTVSRVHLRGYLREQHIVWAEDPTNEDSRYTRVRARQALTSLSSIGIDPERLARTARSMADASEILEDRANALAERICRSSSLGFVSFDPVLLCTAPRETALRLLARMLCTISGQVYRPRLDALEALLTALCSTSFQGRTLHGCIVDLYRGHCIVQREPSACTDTIRVRSSRVLWDKRFEVVLPPELSTRRDLHIAATGETGLRRLKAEKATLSKEWTATPRPARLCTPALWQDETLIAVPLAGWCVDDSAGKVVAVTIDTVPVDPDGEAFI